MLAALAMSSVIASAAQAEKSYTATGVSSAKVHAVDSTEARDTFTAGGTITCQGATFASGLTAVPSNDLTITPTYTNCKAFGLPATVQMNGCTYTFNTPGIVGAHFGADVDLVCPGTVVEVKVWASHNAHTENKTPICNVTVEPSTTLTGGVTMANNPNGTVAIEPNTVGSIPYVVHKSSFLCPGVNTETKTDGIYHVAPKTVTGADEEGNPVPVHVG
ncbi:MAG TPA: hypothetical protein VEQ41_01590 [Solirubrobacterales bacterium]|nr:hypothetical protein [Solirubrobacterales bacterium]